MILYHRTTDEAAAAILRDGFRDSSEFTAFGLKGVFVSDVPLDCHEGAKGDALLRIDLEGDIATLDEYELIEWMANPNREWIVPARLLNRGKVQLWDEFDDCPA